MITTNPYEILDNAVSLAKTNTTGEIELKLIGRPSAFSSTIDRKRSATKYLQSKMNIVDLIPCDFAINVSSFFDSNQNFSTSNIDLTSLIQHTVTYDVPCDRYKTQQEYYNLEKTYAGLRLYVTDETPASDSMNNTFTPSVLFSKLNNFSEQFAGLRELVKTGGEQVRRGISSAQAALTQTASAAVTDFTSVLTDNSGNIGDNVKNALNMIGNMALYGHKMPVPLYWQDSDYAPSLNVNLKLISPSGHPKAIKKFIIEPLLYILLLASSKTFDGITYGSAGMCSVYAYGLTQIPVAGIQSIVLNRGGSTTAFNIFKQPLMIDVSIGFQTLVSGFAAYSPDFSNTLQVDNPESDVFPKSDTANASSAVQSKTRKFIVTDSKSLMGTPGKIIESLRPVDIYELGIAATKSNVAESAEQSENSSNPDVKNTSENLNQQQPNELNTGQTQTTSKFSSNEFFDNKNNFKIIKNGDKYEIKMKNGIVASMTYDELPPKYKKMVVK